MNKMKKDSKYLRDLDALVQIVKSKNAFLFGAGKIARGIVMYLKQNNAMPACVLVSNKRSNPDSVLGIPVKSVYDLDEKEQTRPLIICTLAESHNELLAGLPNLWRGEIYVLDYNLYQEIIGTVLDYNLEVRDKVDEILGRVNYNKYSLLKLVPKPCLQYMVVNVCDHCNLRCKGCDHFACIADEYFVEYDVIARDIDRMSELFHGDYILKIAVMGGEPLLHPDIKKILSKVRSAFRYAQVRLTTNGILLGKQDQEFWEVCRENNITIVNTKYPIKINHEELRKKASEEGVAFMHYEGTGGTSVRKLQKHIIDPEGKSDTVSRFVDCHVSNYGNFLMEGKLYSCPFSCQAYRIFEKKFGVGLRMTEQDYVDIYKVQDMKEILEFAARPKFFCRYCGARSQNYDWEPSRQKASEWLDE